jgi:hypothetical protein
MHSRYLLLTLLLGWLGAAAGCGSSLPTSADPQRARETLRIALDAWKSGESSDALQKRSPPIHVRDVDWSDGWKLKDYRFTLDDEQYGQQRRCYVRLSLESPKGKAAGKEVQYLIDTAPALVIVRAED